MSDFIEFPKLARLHRDMIITEKIDGTNAQILIGEDGTFKCGSRNRWLELGNDNFGFCKWAHENKEELLKLGPGRHFGEWCGKGIQRHYDLQEKKFALFNVSRWTDERPACCSVVPTLLKWTFSEQKILECLEDLKKNGSKFSPGFMKPEGIVIFHTGNMIGFKKTIENDDLPKSKVPKDVEL